MIICNLFLACDILLRRGDGTLSLPQALWKICDGLFALTAGDTTHSARRENFVVHLEDERQTPGNRAKCYLE